VVTVTASVTNTFNGGVDRVYFYVDCDPNGGTAGPYWTVGYVPLSGNPTTATASLPIDHKSPAAASACGLPPGQALSGRHAVLVNARLGTAATSGDVLSEGRWWLSWYNNPAERKREVEWQGMAPEGQTWKLYYYAGGQRVAERVLTGRSNKLYYLHGDHLGSMSKVTCGNSACATGGITVGAVVASQYYYPFGGVRHISGTLPTDFGFTGQRHDGYIKLVQMGVRWYDPETGSWASPDITVPQLGNPQALNRYTFVYNNPLRYIDPFGYCGFDANGSIDGFDCDPDWFDQQDIPTRLKWIRQFMKQTGSDRWFNNIEGILDAFELLGVAQPGSWLSLVDAGILHAIQDGYAWSIGDVSSSVNFGADEWKTFFDALHGRGVYAADPASSAQLGALWSRAELQGTAYGINVLAAGISPSAREQDFLRIGDLYRAVGTTPNGGGAAGAATGGPMGLSAGVVVGALVCVGNPLCVGVGAVIGGGVGSTAGYSSGNWLVDPRNKAFGHSPVYYVAIAILRD
jgi:RHS repeat-associated protein